MYRGTCTAKNSEEGQYPHLHPLALTRTTSGEQNTANYLGMSKSDFRVVALRQNDFHRVSDIELSGLTYISAVRLLAILQFDFPTEPGSVWSGLYQLCFIYLNIYILVYCVVRSGLLLYLYI